jgi:hypothetical protein
MFALANQAIPIGCDKLGASAASENRMSACLRKSALLIKA